MDGQTGEPRDRFAPIVTPLGTRRAALRALAAGAMGGVVASIVAAPRVEAEQRQGWRLCRKCRGLFWGDATSCPAGGLHSQGSDKNYVLTYGGTPAAGEETNWRWCQFCGLLTYFGRGPCPSLSGGGAHWSIPTDYHLEYNQPPEPNEERGWRYCPKCEGLFKPRRHRRGVCPAGGAHKPYPDYFYNLDFLRD